ncbi:hypothetical protein [Nocardia sp. CA-135398]|uniref:hypothetical protein n=1 Tax=Nocardia sp. CA-135398 TaxID=3239977 RepID=UPI003D971B04
MNNRAEWVERQVSGEHHSLSILLLLAVTISLLDVGIDAESGECGMKFDTARAAGATAGYGL